MKIMFFFLKKGLNFITIIKLNAPSNISLYSFPFMKIIEYIEIFLPFDAGWYKTASVFSVEYPKLIDSCKLNPVLSKNKMFFYLWPSILEAKVVLSNLSVDVCKTTAFF